MGAVNVNSRLARFLKWDCVGHFADCLNYRWRASAIVFILWGLILLYHGIFRIPSH